MLTATHKRCPVCRCWLQYLFFGEDASKVGNIADVCLRCEKKAQETESMPVPAMKTCKVCWVSRSLSEFSKGSRTCKKCSSRLSRKRYQTDADFREKRNQYARDRHARLGRPRDPSKEREARLLRKYCLTLEDYDTMLDAQGGKCAICGTDTPTGGHGRFAIDHDHETGKIRGLLCPKCNTGLGMFGDDLECLNAASKYLENSQ